MEESSSFSSAKSQSPQRVEGSKPRFAPVITFHCSPCLFLRERDKKRKQTLRKQPKILKHGVQFFPELLGTPQGNQHQAQEMSSQRRGLVFFFFFFFCKEKKENPDEQGKELDVQVQPTITPPPRQQGGDFSG